MKKELIHEVCSDNSLKYYSNTLTNLMNSIQKNEDLSKQQPPEYASLDIPLPVFPFSFFY